MAWVLARALPFDVVAMIEQAAREEVPLCLCAKCGRLLLTQGSEAVVRAGERFTYSMAFGPLVVAVNPQRTARLRECAPTAYRTTMVLPIHLVDEDHVHECAETPDRLECGGRTFANERPCMRSHAPFTRLGGRAVCMHCMVDHGADGTTAPP